ncbi:LOW QUALITY PROTEIN: uncharacterized protein LOC134230012 [Saccostrea cucullata]|uniref:LOW QUALITY PROTEIN: uncharacterized protein LOC134230012 n=1 Tax=Saccostrea cuccullata TaxID=36930 RepID=UPI002ED2D95C
MRNDAKKASASPKGRRKLNFVEKKEKLPLTGKSIFVDVKELAQSRLIKEDIKRLGARVDEFFHKEINYVITSNRTSRSDKHDPLQSPDSPSTVSTPSPFNTGPSPSPAAGNKPSQESVIRGKAIAKRAVTKETNPVLTNAENWGIKIVTLDVAQKWIQREISKLPQSNSKPKSNVNNVQGGCKVKKLKTPYLKLESVTRQYKVVYHQAEVWPHANVETPRGTCPFDGTSVGGEKSREERGDRIGLIPLEPRTPESKTGQGGSTKSQENSKSSNRKAPQKGQRTSIIGGVRIVTAGEIRRRKELKRLQEKRRGYCECCEVKYDDLTKHVREEQHKEFIREKKHYQDLDCLINSGPSQATFLKRVLEQCCQTAGGTRSNVEKSVKRVEATPPSVQKSMKTISSKTTLKIVNSEVKQRRRQSPRKVWQNASEHEQTKLLKDSIEQDIRQRKEIRRSTEIDLQLENHYVPTRTRNFLFVQGTSSQNSDRAGLKNDNHAEIGTNKLKDSSLINRKNEQCHSAVVKDSVTGSERSPKTTTCSKALQGSSKIRDQECKSNNRRNKDKQFQSPYNKDVESYKKTLKSPRKKSPQHRKSREEVDSVNVENEKNSSQTVASERSARKSTAEIEECVLKRRLRSPKMATLPNKETTESTKAKGEKSKVLDCELRREGEEMLNQMINKIKDSNSTESLKVDMDKTEADNFKEKGHAEHIKTRSRSAGSKERHGDKKELSNARSKCKPKKSKGKGASSKKITVEIDEQASDDIEIVSCDEDTSSNEQDVGNLCDVNNENASGLQGRVKNMVGPVNCNDEPSTSTVTVQNDDKCSTVEVNAVHEDDSPKKHRRLRSRKSLLTEYRDDTSKCQIERAELKVHPHQTSKSPSVMNKMMAIKNANLAAPLSVKKLLSSKQKDSTAKILQTCIDLKPEKENVGQSENVQETFEEEKVFDEQVEKSLFYIERVHRLRSTDQRQNCVDRELQDISVKVQERNSRPNSPVPGDWGRNNCVPASPVFKSSPRLAGLRTPSKRIISSAESVNQTTPVVSSPKSGLSNTPRSNKRKRWNKRRESKSDENSLNTPKVKRLEKLKYPTANGKNCEKVIDVDNAATRKEKIGGKNKIPTGAKNEIDNTTSQKIQNSKNEQLDTTITVKEILRENLKSPLKDTKIKSPLKRTSLEKKCVSPRRGSTPLVWRNAKGSTPKGRKKRIKLNKSWSVLSDRSVNKLLHESDSESNFEGFDEGDLTGQSSLCSDASFVEINEVEFEENSDQEWELEQENVEGRMKDDDEGGVFPEIFSSPGKRSDSSWDTGFVDFIDTQLSNKKKSPKKNATLLSAEAASLCSPRRRQRLESIPEGSTENQLQRVRKRRKVEEKEEEFQSFMVSDVSAQVDEDIQFNFSSPNKRKSKVMKNKSHEPKRGKSLDYGLPVKEVRLTGCLLRRQMLKMAKSKTLRSSERKESLTNSDCEIECSNMNGQKTKHKSDRESKCFDDDSMPNLSPQGNKRIAKNSISFGGRSSDIPNLSPQMQRHSSPVVNNRRSRRT